MTGFKNQGAIRRILLTGSTGQVGWELQRTLMPLGEILAPTRDEFDLSQPELLRKKIRDWKPDIIVNPAAYTAVDTAETESELAFKINAEAPKVLAEESDRLNIPLVHYSTDYVFDGKKNKPYTEDDAVNPLNVYGESKFMGEQAIRSVTERHLILRTSWVYSMRGKNFLTTMLRLFREANGVNVVDDQIGAPTWSRFIAEATSNVLGRFSVMEDEYWGTFHLSAGGDASWFDFARRIKKLANQDYQVEINPISSEKYNQSADRPKDSRLSNARLKSIFGMEQMDWKVALSLCMAR